MARKNSNTQLQSRPSPADSAKPLITLAMIVKDEEEFLADCLASAKPFVDEIVVVDTGSTDRTKEIAASFGAKVYDHQWKDDFAEARNVSIEHSTGEWILWLDADEVLAEGSGELLRKAAQDQKIGGYMATIRNYQDRKRSMALVHENCRLFRNVPGLKFAQRIHEQMVNHIVRHGYQIASSKIVVDHFGYIPEVFAQRNKERRNAELLRLELEDHPDNMWLVYKQAATYGACENFDKAVELYEKVEASGLAEDVGVQLYYEWAECLTGAGRPGEAVEVCKKAKANGYEHPELHFVWGRALSAYGALDEALAEYQTAVDTGDGKSLLFGDSSTWGFRAYNGMARVHVSRRDWEKALDCIEKSQQMMPDDVEALGLAAAVYRAIGQIGETKRVLARVVSIDPDEPNALGDLAKLAVEQMDFPTALMHLQKLAEVCPDRFEVHQQLGNVYEELSMPDEALAAYERTVQIQPRCLYALNNAARILADKGEYQKALDTISRAIEIDPHWANAYFNAGDILYKVGALEDAKCAYEQALRLDPSNAAGFFVLGNCYAKQGAYRAAQLAYCQALSIRPDYAEAENNLELIQGFMEEPVVSQMAGAVVYQAA